jgi:CRP-like cAMP-binding protein
MESVPTTGWLAKCLGNSTASPLGEDDLEALLAVSRVKRATADELLFTRADPIQDVYILEKGKVALTRTNSDRIPILQILHAGDVFGDVGLFLGRAAPVDAIVLEDALVLCIPGPELVRLLSTRPRIAMRWMVSMAARLAESQNRLEQLLAGPLDHQLASLLTHAASSEGTVAASQEMLARLLGTRRPSIARSLASLEKRGLVERHYREIRIIDADRLVAMTR